jgi:hypothetical protein
LWSAFGHAYRANRARADAEVEPVLQQMNQRLRAEADKQASTTSP